MQKLGLQVTSFTGKSRKYSSYKGKIRQIAPNRIHHRFNTCIPHQKIATDTTEFKYYDVDDKGRMTIQKLYLDPFMDMFHSEIISYGIDKHPSAQKVMGELKDAIERYIDYYNNHTIKQKLSWMSPVEYRLSLVV